MERQAHNQTATLRPTRLQVEALEDRTAPATLVGPTTVTYKDADRDHVRVTFSKPILTAANVNSVFTFDAGTVDGVNESPQQLRAINLSGNVAAAGLVAGLHNLGADDAPGGTCENADNVNFGDTHDTFIGLGSVFNRIDSIVIGGIVVGSAAA